MGVDRRTAAGYNAVTMPEICRFFGIIISFNYRDHPPPHFHVRYGDQKAIIDIESLRLLEGSLSPRVRGMVIEWAAQHQSELMDNWDRARRCQPVNAIDPLE
jgi:hypothetical protein